MIGAEVDVEAVGEHERLARGHVGRDFVVVEIGLDMIGDQDHDHVGGLGGVGGGEDLEAGGLGLGDALAAGGQADDDIDAGIAEVQGVGVALAAVADDGDGAAGEVIEVSVFFVIAFRHLSSRNSFCTWQTAWPWPIGGNRGLEAQFLGIQGDGEGAAAGNIDFAVGAHDVDEFAEFFGVAGDFDGKAFGGRNRPRARRRSRLP